MARRETPREMPDMTPAQRRANWWHYHWRHVLLGGIILAILGGILLDQARERKPDCCVALVTRREADSQTLSSLQAALERVSPDSNGDGEVHVDVYSIQIDYTSQDLSPEALRVMEANVDKLNFDFYTRRSGIFLLDDPENFQRNHQALAYLDGSTPPEGSEDWENMTVPWADWPGSESVELGNRREDSLWFARRIVTGPKDEAALAGAQALWETMFQES